MSYKNLSFVFLGVLLGVYFTYFTIHFELLPPVLASAVTGLLASITFVKRFKSPPYLGIAMYCGSFAGMGQVFSASELLLTTVLASLLIVIFSKFFQGFGGKLGFMAYLASILTQIFIIFIGSKGLEEFHLIGVVSNFKPTLDIPTSIAVVLSSIIGFYLTVYFHHGLKKSAVFSSAFPSFIVGLLYFIPFAYSDIVMVTFFSASFVGMVAEDVLPKKHFPFVVLTHILTILLFKNNLGEFGGALGTIAFFSVFMIIQIDVILNKRIK